MTATQDWQDPARERLVRLCAALTRDADAAEDLAQETLLEAWRNGHKLHDPEGAERWLSAIARNVCLRWARRRGRDLGRVEPLTLEHDAPDVDLAEELEREELVELLDRALALLPSQTRDVLVQRFVNDSPHADIAARLGITEDAVSMRISRGKILLRRLLTSELHDEAAAYGLVDAGWQRTRVWCQHCGRGTMLIRRKSRDAISFWCSRCNPHTPTSMFDLSNPTFRALIGDLVRPSAILARTANWAEGYFAAGSEARGMRCTRCGRAVKLETYRRDTACSSERQSRGLFAHCDACGEEVACSVAGVAAALPAVRRFRREHLRIAAMPQRHVELAGAPALLVRYEEVAGRAGVDVLFAHDTLRVLEVHTR